MRVAWLLRVEGVVVLAAAVLLFRQSAASWWLFAVLFLAPDVAMLGYLAGPRVGAAVYNLIHLYVGPLATLGLALLLALPALSTVGAVWLAHIGADRLFGYGLKYPTAFKDTHLQRV